MSAEAVVKKRGRPKKTDGIRTDSRDLAEEAPITTSKRSTKTRSISIIEASSKPAAAKKSSRRKTLTGDNGMSNADGDEESKTKASRAIRSVRPSSSLKSKILERATAFEKLKVSDTISMAANSAVGDQSSVPSVKVHAKLESVSKPSEVISPGANSQSSFLSSFLSDAPDPTPEAPESSKISDRSAFKAPKISVDDIISGVGVSNLSALTTTKQQDTNTPKQRSSAIPIMAPKSFKSHKLSAFPDRPEQQKQRTPPPQKTVEPETYTLGSFQAFKSVQSATSATTRKPMISASTVNAVSSTDQSPRVPPKSTVAADQPRPIRQQQFTSQAPSSSTTSAPSRPQPQLPPEANPSSPATSPSTPSSPRLPKTHTRPGPHYPQKITPSTTSSGPSTFRPKRPTEMTPAELLKNPEFKALRRKYTGLIVGIPVLVVTSYILWNRVNLTDETARRMAGPGAGEGEAETRVRGQLPRRVLDDGGLDRN